ncbi:MAG: hypothetical protein JSU90_10475 [Nitrospiraceae bacterium]|nr:MAG: hypothetical protein JSU90_10475 [Nitrospiraceae bacterium]
MDPKYYCDTVRSELTGLKARAYDMLRQLDKMQNREKLMTEFKEVHALVDDLNVTIDKLSSQCPTDWGTQKNDIEKKKAALLAKITWWDKEHIAGGYVGG